MSPATEISQARKIDHERQSTEPSADPLLAFTFQRDVLILITAIIQCSVTLYGSPLVCLRSRDNDNIGSFIRHHSESTGI